MDNLISIPEFNLTDQDKQKLEASGIPTALQTEYGIRRVTDEEGSLIVGQQRKAGRDLSGLLFPIFNNPNQTQPVEYELRRDLPDEILENNIRKEIGKYLRPPGRGNLLALPRNISAEALNDISIPLLICEGIKKLLAALYLSTWNLAPGEKPRFIPVSIPGVWNFRGKVGKAIDANGHRREIKGLLTGFQQINMKHRSVIIAFDNDVFTNFKVKLARHTLADNLQTETGANVYFVELPKSDEKIGLDDYLGNLNGNLSEGLELLETKYRFSNELQSVLLDRKITLGTIGADRGKCKLTVRNNEGESIAADVFDLAQADKRNKFIKQIEAVLTLSNEDKTEIQRELLGLSDISDALTEETEPQAVTSEKFILSEILSDNRIIEALSTNQFAVYDPEKDAIEYADTITDGETLYKPLHDSFAEKILVDKVEDYSNEVELVSELESYVHRHYDLPVFERKIAVYYILLTYVRDKYFVIPYLHPRGASGTGKTRFSDTVVNACYRPYSVVSVTSASLFRFIDKYQPTLFLDEFNPKENEKADVIDVLLSGNQQGKYVNRINLNSGETETFNPFGCKIISSYRKFGDEALESRSIEIETKETNRKDIQFTNTGQIQVDALPLRRKLLMFRFRNLHRDFNKEVQETEKLLTSFTNENGDFEIRLRYIEKSTPLLALIKDESVRNEFINLLKRQTKTTKQLNKESFDFDVIEAIHEILFETEGDRIELRDSYQYEFDLDGKLIKGSNNNPSYDIQTIDGEFCEALTVENIVQRLNHSRQNPKDKIEPRSFGKTLINRYGFETQKCGKRIEHLRDKKIVIFNKERLATLFKTYDLPVSDFFNVANVANEVKGNTVNSLSMATLNQNESANNFNVASDKYNKTGEIPCVATLATLDFPNMSGDIKNNAQKLRGEV